MLLTIKRFLYSLCVVGLVVSCEANQDINAENEPGQIPVDETETGSEDNEVDLENVTAFLASIISPQKDRDFTYHNLGNQGIFEDPESPTSLGGKVQLEYLESNDPVPAYRINVKWLSDIDGILFQGTLNEQYENNFEMSLSKGNHKIIFEASIDSDPDFIAKDSVSISNVISLKLEPTDRSTKLSWSKYHGIDFQSYLLYREDYEPIAEITNIDILEYEDLEVTLAENQRFQVVVKTQGNEDFISGSNIKEAVAGKFIKLDHFITKAIIDKNRNQVYATVGEKYPSFRYASEYGLVVISNNHEGIEVNSHILKEHRFSDMDMSADGKYLFLSQRGVDKITRLNLENSEVERFDVAYGGWGVHKIEVGNNYRLYCHRTPPTSGDSHFYILDGLTGARLNDDGSLIHGDMEFNIHNNQLYHGTTVREKYVGKYSVENDDLIREKMFSPEIGWPKPFILLSEDGENIFWEQFQLDQDLNVIREFDSPIIACNLYSSIISDGDRLLNFNNLQTVLEYPNFPFHDASSEIFTNDDSVLIIKASQPYTNDRHSYIFKIKIN